MRTFMIKLIDCAAIVAILIAYQCFVTEQNERDARKLQAVAAAGTETEQLDGSGQMASVYEDGVYTGTGTGFGGEITVKLTVSSNTITELTIVSAEQETPEYLEAAKALLETVVEENSVEVETVSGATLSSNGILEGAANALEQARTTKETE